MDSLIADTFTDVPARLTGEEQQAVKTAAFDLQMIGGRAFSHKSLVMSWMPFMDLETRRAS